MNELKEGMDALKEKRNMERDRLDERLGKNRERVDQEELFAPHMAEKRNITMGELVKDYAAIIDKQREEIKGLHAELEYYRGFAEQLGAKKAVSQRDKMLEEFREIEQILGKALKYPWFKDDQYNFPNATEADGVAIGDHTAWSLAHQAADKIKELAEEVDRHNARVHKLSLNEWRTFDQS
jgi:ribosome-binding protein aMBF1 (putative translation factor)